MNQSKKPAPPDELSDAGADMWTEIVKGYDLRADELRVLRDACFEADLIDAMQKSVGDSFITLGSQGQQVASPLLSELRQHRGTLSTLLKQLKLPDPADTAEARSTQARDAANSRWHKRAAGN